MLVGGCCAAAAAAAAPVVGPAAASASAAPAPLLDPAGMEFVPMGFYSAEPVRVTATNIREFRHGPNAVGLVGIFDSSGSTQPTVGCDSTGACGWALLHKWLSRCDEVGSAVFFNLETQYNAAKTNSTVALAAMTEIVGQVRHHRSIVGWCE